MWKRSFQSLRSNKDDTGSALKRRKDAVEGRLQRVKKYTEDQAATDQHDEDHAEHPYPVIYLQSVIRQKVTQDVASIKWRNRNQVEHKEQKIEEDDVVKKERYRKQRRQAINRDTPHMMSDQPCRFNRHPSTRNRMLHHQQKDQRHDRHQQIARGTGQRNDNVVSAIVLEIPRGNRGGLRPAEQHPSVEQP